MNKITKNIAALIALGVGITTIGTAQVTQQKIGNNPTTISPSAVFEVESTNKGALLPRVSLTSLTDATTIANPADALTVFNTATTGAAPNDVTPGYYYWKKDLVTPANSKWVRVLTTVDIPTEPWKIQATTNSAVANGDNIYQNAKVGVGNFSGSVTSKQFEVKGDFKAEVVNGSVVYGTEVNSPLNPASGMHYWKDGPTYRIASANASAATLLAQTGTTTNTIAAQADQAAMSSQGGTNSLSTIRTTNTGNFFMETYNLTGNYGSTFSLQNDGLRLVHTTTNGAGDPFPTPNRSEILLQKQNGVGFDFRDATGAVKANYWFPTTTGTADQVMTQTATGKAVWADSSKDWHITGNNDIVNGTHFLGTTNNVPLAFRVNDLPAGLITSSGTVTLGINANTKTKNPGNTAIGHEALKENTYGFNNVAVGYQALTANIEGKDLVAVGNRALENFIGATGSESSNIGIGSQAGKTLTSGSKNIFIGSQTKPNISPTDSYQLNIGNGIFGTGFSSNDIATPAGRVGLLILDPTELLDLGGSATAGQGGLRIQNINSAAYTGALAALAPNTTTTGGAGIGIATDRIVVASSTGVLKTVPAASVAVEPWFVQGTTVPATTDAQNIFHTGKVAIGRNTMFGAPGSEMFAVNGSIRTASSVYADYVFEDYFNGKSEIKTDYKFKTLKEVENYILMHKHLPGVTPIKDLLKTEEGYSFNLTDLSVQSLEKLEELFLYVIEQQKQLDEKDKKIETLMQTLKVQTDQTNERFEKLEKALLDTK